MIDYGNRQLLSNSLSYAHVRETLFRSMVLLAMILCGCSVFAPREREHPDPDRPEQKDYFEVRQILHGTGEQFRSIEYEDVFLRDSFTFSDNEESRFPWHSFTGHLRTLENKIVGGELQLAVNWGMESGAGDPPQFSREDIVVIYRRYEYTLTQSKPDTSGISNNQSTLTESGVARLDLKYNRVRGTWEIRSWRDIPDHGIRSLFHPEYELPLD